MTSAKKTATKKKITFEERARTPKPGWWWYSSADDPRWDCKGRGDLLLSAGPPAEARQALAMLCAAYGAPPLDLTYGCMKD